MAVANRLRVSYPATPESAAQVRADVTRFVEDAGLGEERLAAVRTAVSEAVANVITHAYPAGPGQIHLTATVADAELRFRIADDGVGCNAPSAHPGMGLGLGLVADACSSVTLEERRSGGTVLAMAFVLDDSV